MSSNMNKSYQLIISNCFARMLNNKPDMCHSKQYALKLIFLS
jgi:hypothetical protein